MGTARTLTRGSSAPAPRNFSKPISGDVSPEEPLSSAHSGEVSPIEPGYEDELADDKPEAVSPLMPRSLPLQQQPLLPVERSQSAERPQPVKPKPSTVKAAQSTQVPIGQERQRRRAGPTEDDYVKAENRVAHVLPEDYQDPPRNLPGMKAAAAATAVAAGKHVSDSSAQQAVLANKGLPPVDKTVPSKKRSTCPTPSEAPIAAANLAPLRELKEAPHDTSADATTRMPVHRATSSSSANHAGATTVTADQQPARRHVAVPTSKVEQAAPARPKRSTDSSREAISNDSRNGRKTSSRHGASLSHASTSDGSRGALESDGQSRGSGSPRDHQKSFEQLMNSGETIQYTLTPQNMREIEVRTLA